MPAPLANGPSADYPMVLGPQFSVDGVTYTPADTMNYDAVGFAGISAEGGSGVSGSHRTLPLPSYVEVTSLESGKTVLVRMERRGPMTGSQLVELSPGAFAQLGMAGSTRNAVRVRRVNPPEVERAMLRSGQQAPARMDTPKSLLVVLQRKLDQQMGVVTPPPAPVPEAAASPAPAVTPNKPPKAPAKPAKSAPKPAVTGKPDSASSKTDIKPAATPKPVEPKVAAKGTWYVQIGTFASKANADAAAKKAGATVVQSGKLWRVRSEPFVAEDKAGPALAKARAAGYSDARIQRAD
ncbi:SPOR domain-containing protein [Novosphingobium aquiterrae]|uniref:SPOR domain-containing protein n=1 Tax=Novosphingobium aquiterrae TaxID=624388 RepID=A0ABV6PID5_9SPHN